MKEKITQILLDFFGSLTNEDDVVSLMKEKLPSVIDESGEIDFEKVIANRDEVFSVIFPELVGISEKEVVDALIGLELPDDFKYEFGSAFFTDKHIKELFEILYEQHGLETIQLLDPVRDIAVSVALDKGFSVQDLIPFVDGHNKNVVRVLYERDKSCFNELFNKISRYSILDHYEIIVDEIIEGNDYVLATIFDKWDGNTKDRDLKQLLSLIINKLVELNKFDANKLFSLIELSGAEYKDFISCIEDPVLMEKMIKASGGRALIFCKNIPKEIVDMAPSVSYEDYKLIKGDYKDSPYLLQRLCEEDPKRVPFYYATTDSLTEVTAPYLESLSDEDIKGISSNYNSEISRNYLFLKERKKRGMHVSLDTIDNIGTDLGAYKFYEECVKEGLDRVPNSFEKTFIPYIFITKEYSKYDGSYIGTFSTEVARYIIDSGLDVEDYVKYFKSVDAITREFLDRGFTQVLFMENVDYQLMRDFEHLIKYEDYIKLREERPDLTVNESVLQKFVKEGHYDILELLNPRQLQEEYYLHELGLQNLTYEEYLKADPRVQAMPSLKMKFGAEHPELLADVVDQLPDHPKIISYRIVNGLMTYEDYMSEYGHVERFSKPSLSKEAIIKFIDEGHFDILLHADISYSYDAEVIEHYISKLNGKEFDPEIVARYSGYFIDYYLKNKDFSFLDVMTYYRDDDVKKIIDAGLTLDQFMSSKCKFDKFLFYFISKENEQKLIQCIEEKFKDSYFRSIDASFILKCIDCGFEYESINKILKINDIKVVDLLKNIPKEKYEIFEHLDIKNMFINKTVTDILLNSLSAEKIKSCLTYATRDVKMYVIKKMVELGHNDFIECYSSGMDKEVVKRALLAGYFPGETTLYNAQYRKDLLELEFTPEELDYLRHRLDKCPYLVLYFKEITSDPKLLIEYIINEPGLLMFFDGEIINNVSLLYEIYQKNIDIFNTIINRSDITSDTIVNLYLNYDLDLKYIRSKLSYDVSSELVVKYPYLIDETTKVYSSTILKAFENGYKLSDRSSSDAIAVAFSYGLNQPGDEQYLDKLSDYAMGNLIYKIKYEDFIKNKDILLDKYFNGVFLTSYNNYLTTDDERVSRYINLNFYLSNIADDSITEEEKGIILDALNKYGINKKYMNANYYSLVKLFGEEYLINCFFEGKVHMDMLRFVKLTPEQLELASAKLEKDYKNGEYSIEEKIEFVSLFKRLDIYNDFVKGIYDDLYESYLAGVEVDGLRAVFPSEYLYDKLMTDDKFNLNLIKNLNYAYEEEKKKNVALRILELMQKNTYSIAEYETVCSWFNYNDFREEANKLAMTVFELDPERFAYYVSDPTPEFLEEVPKFLRDHPMLICRFDIVLDDKDLVVYLIGAGYLDAYNKATDELKNDIDVSKALINIQPDKISEVSLDNPYYYELLKAAVAKKGELIVSEFERNPELKNNIEIIRIAAITYPNVITMVDSSLVDDNLLNIVGDFSTIDFSNVSVELFEKLLVRMDAKGLDTRNNSIIITYINNHLDNEKLLSNDIVIKCITNSISDPTLFKNVVLLSNNNIIRSKLKEEDLKIFDDAIYILNSTGKQNFLEKNPIFSYDLVKYVYPVLGLEDTINLMSYTTGADKEVIRLIKNGDTEFVKSYIALLREQNVFENNDKFMHYAFRHFSSIENLIRSVLASGRVLTDDELGDLKKIILKNRFDIQSLNELSNYDAIMVDKINTAFESGDLSAIKNYLALFFGYSSIATMTKEFENFQFGNFAILKYVLNDIKSNYGEEVYNKIKITSEEMSLIVLMKKIIESNDVKFLRELIDRYIINNESDKDFNDDVQNLTAKFRLLMNYQYNAHLTKLDEKVASASEYKDTGVKVIEFNGEQFNFLAHRLYTYDHSNAGFADKLMADPSLWTALDGATTVSCSSFSDKGFHFLHSWDSKGVVYLFNELPEEFMLFMYGRDLYVEHGGYKMEPTAASNSFTDIDGLNQNSCYHHCDYNEVAGFRKGMLPCAFVCIGDEPNEETIRAAQYFSQVLGKEIPIIKFNKNVYSNQVTEQYNAAINEIRSNVSVELINKVFLSGVQVPIIDTTSMILDTICRNVSEGVIDEKYAVACLTELQTVINRSCLGGREATNAKLALNKVDALKKTMVTMAALSKEEVMQIETAKMGESGIMYKYSQGEDTYLLKPAVDKQENKGQPFRAEVQEAASKLQRMLNADSAVDVEAIGNKTFKVSKQELIDVDPDKKRYLEDWVANGGTIDSTIADQLMREYVVDMLLCNFDCFAGNFVIDTSGNLRGIDKEQSFRFINNPESLKADFSYVPNGSARIPIYQYIFKRYESGQLDISFDAVYETLEAVDCLSDDDYRALFTEYAKSYDPNNYEELLDKIVKRKHDVSTNIRRYIDSIVSKKNAEEFRI